MPKNVRDLGKLIVANLKSCPKSKKSPTLVTLHAILVLWLASQYLCLTQFRPLFVICLSLSHSLAIHLSVGSTFAHLPFSLSSSIYVSKSTIKLKYLSIISIGISFSLSGPYSFSLSTHLCMSILKFTHVLSSLPTFLYLSLSTTVFVSLFVSLFCSSCQYFCSKVFSRILCSKH